MEGNPVRWRYTILEVNIADTPWEFRVYNTQAPGWKDTGAADPAAVFSSRGAARRWIEQQEYLGGYAKKSPMSP
jgi:hypothetical protein